MLVFAGFALVWIKTAMQQISKNYFKSKLFAYFFCIFAFFVVPLRAILRVCTLFVTYAYARVANKKI